MASIAKHLVAVFYLPKKSAEIKIREVLEAIDASSIAESSNFPGTQATCWWTNMSCLSYLTSLQFHHALEMWFPHSDFMRFRDFTKTQNVLNSLTPQKNAENLAISFRNACEVLLPDVAFIITHPWQASREVIYSTEWMVLAKAANAL